MTNLPFERFESTQWNRFYFNLYIQDENKTADPKLVWRSKDGKETKEIRKLQWVITNITFKDREWELNWKAKTSRNVMITLQDEQKPENFYIIRWDFTSVMRNILNAFASQKELGYVSLSFYVNKAWYASVGVYWRGDMMTWKLSIDEQKALMRDVIDPETKEKLKTDFSKLDAKLEELVSAIPTTPQSDYDLDAIIAEEVEETKAEKEDIEDLPF